METTKTTVQPWKVTKDGIFGGYDNYQEIRAGIGYYDGNDGFRLSGFCSKENALLISKAPEMLEMLESCLLAFQQLGLKEPEGIKQLIKEATEL